MARVDIDNLRVLFGGVAAVDGISLVLNDGEFIVLLGPSGCGKTTTLRCVAGLQQSTSGDIRFNGKSVTGLPPAKRNIGMVFQFVSLYPHLSVRENIAFPLRARGVPRSQVAAKVDRVVQVFAIGDILDRIVIGLPPGSRQKVALARAVVREPDVLLLDEPLSGVEEQYREEMRWELRQFQQELGVTTVHVTHDQREAMSLADRVVLMQSGKIVQAGPPAALFDNPVDRFAAAFIGSPTMNFLPLKLTGSGLSLESEPALQFPTPPDLLDRLRASRIDQVVVGIRPHFVQLTADDGGSDGWPAKLLHAIQIGRDVHADFAVGALTIKAELPGGTALPSAAALRCPPERCLFFGPDGSRLG
jgi:ABC-type sugar transport system ATPase subunit